MTNEQAGRLVAGLMTQDTALRCRVKQYHWATEAYFNERTRGSATKMKDKHRKCLTLIMDLGGLTDRQAGRGLAFVLRGMRWPE